MRFSTTFAIIGFDWGHLKQSKGGIENGELIERLGLEYWREELEKKKKREERKIMERTRSEISVFGDKSFWFLSLLQAFAMEMDPDVLFRV